MGNDDGESMKNQENKKKVRKENQEMGKKNYIQVAKYLINIIPWQIHELLSGYFGYLPSN